MSIEVITNLTLSSLTVLGQILILFLVFFKKVKIKFNWMLGALIVAIVATAGSLVYSEVVGYTPCKLCWFQRVFMYPQTILLALAYFKKDKNIKTYIQTLCGIGGSISIYHYIIQLLAKPSFFCSVGSVDCAQRVTLQFGYITIPLMALTAFALIFLMVGKK